MASAAIRNPFFLPLDVHQKMPAKKWTSVSTIGDGVEVKASTIHGAGRGLFATKRFKKGNIITEFDGEIISRDEALRRRLAREDSHIAGLDFDTQIDGINVQAVDGKGGASFANDPRDTKRVNAKKVENQVIHGVIRTGEPTLTRAFLEATKQIDEGDEIFVDYKSTYWKVRDPVEEKERVPRAPRAAPVLPGERGRRLGFLTPTLKNMVMNTVLADLAYNRSVAPNSLGFRMTRTSDGSIVHDCALTCIRCPARDPVTLVRCREQVCIGLPFCQLHSRQYFNVEIRDAAGYVKKARQLEPANFGQGLFAVSLDDHEQEEREVLFKKGDLICWYISEQMERGLIHERYPGDMTAPYGFGATKDLAYDAACVRGMGAIANNAHRRYDRRGKKLANNAKIRVQNKQAGITRDINNGELRVGANPFPVIVATRDIRDGEEILADYGDEYDFTGYDVTTGTIPDVPAREPLIPWKPAHIRAVPNFLDDGRVEWSEGTEDEDKEFIDYMPGLHERIRRHRGNRSRTKRKRSKKTAKRKSVKRRRS